MPCDGLEPIAGHEARPVPDPKACRIGPRELKRRQALVDADAGRTRQLGQQRDEDAAAPGAEVEEPQRRLAAGERERSLDQRLGIRAGVERARIDAERAPIELADADDARHRLAGEPPRHVSPEPRRGVRRERIVDPGDIGFVGQACRVAEQEPRIELRRRDPCLAQQPRRCQAADAAAPLPRVCGLTTALPDRVPIARAAEQGGPLRRRRPSSRSRNSPMALFLDGGEQARLMLGDQGIDDLVEAAPLQHQIEAVQREADAVIGDAPLRKIIGADALRAVAGADLAAAGLRPLRIELGAFEIVEPGAQHLHRLRLVLVLRLLVLLADHEARSAYG